MPVSQEALFCECAPKQSSLESYFASNIPRNRDLGTTSFLQLIASPQNFKGATRLSEDLSTAVGKKRPVIIQFDEPVCIQACLKTSACDEAPATFSPATTCETFEIENNYTTCDNGTEKALELNCTQFAAFCERTDGEYAQQQFNMVDSKFFKGLDKSMIVELQSIITAAGPTSVKSMKVFLPTVNGTKTLNPEIFTYMMQLMQDSGIENEYVLVGGSIIQWMTSFLKISTASQEGFDINLLRGDIPQMFYDRNFDAIFGANNFVILPLGTIMPVWYTENKMGCKKFADERLVQDVKFYNLGNGVRLPYDYKWKFEPECGIYTYQPNVYMELYKTVCSGCEVTTANCGIYLIENCDDLPTADCIV